MSSILIESQYIGTCTYWKLLSEADTVLIDVYEHYVRRSYRNRAHLLGANGLLRLSIPLVHGKQQHSAMKEVRISYNENWQALHWHSLTSCYRRSPYFEYYEDAIKRFYEEKFEFLSDYNIQFLKTISKILKTELHITTTDKYISKETFDGSDYRSFCMPSKESVASYSTYPQVFSDRFPFEKDLCVLDLLFNKGTSAKDYLNTIKLIS